MQFWKKGAAVALAIVATSAFPAMAPALAKDQLTAPSFEFSKKFRASARVVRTALDGGNLSGASAELSTLDGLASSPAERYAAAELRLQLASLQNDPRAQRDAIKRVIDSGGATSAEQGRLWFLTGYLSYRDTKWRDAIAQVGKARELGYNNSRVTLVLADSYLKDNKFKEGAALVDEAFGQERAAGRAIPDSWFVRASALAYRMDDMGKYAALTREQLTLYPSAPSWRTILTNFGNKGALDKEARLDIYRLMAATSAIASERDFEAYATAASEAGYPVEAQAVIESGRSSEDLAKTNTVTAKLMTTLPARGKKDLAALPKQASSAKTGDALRKVANAYFANGNYAEAVRYYGLAREKSSSDEVVTRLGIAQARSGDLSSARTTLAQVTSGPWGAVAGYWKAWADAQKG